MSFSAGEIDMDVVAVESAMERANDHHLVHDRCRPRHRFAQVNPRHGVV